MLSQKLENFLAEFSTMNENSKEKSSIIIFAAFQALYLTAVENNAIDENSLTLDVQKFKESLEQLKEELDKIYLANIEAKNIQFSIHSFI